MADEQKPDPQLDCAPVTVNVKSTPGLVMVSIRIGTQSSCHPAFGKFARQPGPIMADGPDPGDPPPPSC